VGVLPGNGRFALGKQQLEPELIGAKYLARVNDCTFGMSTTGQIARTVTVENGSRVIEEDFESGEIGSSHKATSHIQSAPSQKSVYENDQIAGECSCHHEQKNNSLA